MRSGLLAAILFVNFCEALAGEIPSRLSAQSETCQKFASGQEQTESALPDGCPDFQPPLTGEITQIRALASLPAVGIRGELARQLKQQLLRAPWAVQAVQNRLQGIWNLGLAKKLPAGLLGDALRSCKDSAQARSQELGPSAEALFSSVSQLEQGTPPRFLKDRQVPKEVFEKRLILAMMESRRIQDLILTARRLGRKPDQTLGVLFARLRRIRETYPAVEFVREREMPMMLALVSRPQNFQLGAPVLYPELDALLFGELPLKEVPPSGNPRIRFPETINLILRTRFRAGGPESAYLEEIVLRSMSEAFRSAGTACTSQPCEVFHAHLVQVGKSISRLPAGERQMAEQSVCGCEIEASHRPYSTTAILSMAGAGAAVALACGSLFVEAACPVAIGLGATALGIAGTEMTLANSWDAWEDYFKSEGVLASAYGNPGTIPEDKEASEEALRDRRHTALVETGTAAVAGVGGATLNATTGGLATSGRWFSSLFGRQARSASNYWSEVFPASKSGYRAVFGRGMDPFRFVVRSRLPKTRVRRILEIPFHPIAAFKNSATQVTMPVVVGAYFGLYELTQLGMGSWTPEEGESDQGLTVPGAEYVAGMISGGVLNEETGGRLMNDHKAQILLWSKQPDDGRSVLPKVKDLLASGVLQASQLKTLDHLMRQAYKTTVAVSTEPQQGFTVSFSNLLFRNFRQALQSEDSPFRELNQNEMNLVATAFLPPVLISGHKDSELMKAIFLGHGTAAGRYSADSAAALQTVSTLVKQRELSLGEAFIMAAQCLDHPDLLRTKRERAEGLFPSQAARLAQRPDLPAFASPSGLENFPAADELGRWRIILKDPRFQELKSAWLEGKATDMQILSNFQTQATGLDELLRLEKKYAGVPFPKETVEHLLGQGDEEEGNILFGEIKSRLAETFSGSGRPISEAQAWDCTRKLTETTRRGIIEEEKWLTRGVDEAIFLSLRRKMLETQSIEFQKILDSCSVR